VAAGCGGLGTGRGVAWGEAFVCENETTEVKVKKMATEISLFISPLKDV
jgi:hypothetical protein